MIFPKHKKSTPRFIITIYSFLAIVLIISSCKPTDNSKKLLSQALKNKDYATAAFAYNYLLLADSNNLEYKDSLARLYIRSGNFEGGLRLGEQVMAKYPQNNKLLELIGVANEQSNNIDKAVANFNALFKSTQNYIYLYKIAAICFNNEKFAEADSLADLLIIQVTDTSKKIDIPTQNGSNQSVPILAASYNMKGAILAEIAERTGDASKIEKAVPYFKKALQIAPHFSFPRLLLQQIDQYMRGEK